MQDDFEKGEFEKDWQKAFKNAEIKPWRTSWDSVKMDLDAANAKNKRKTFFMFLRYAAVACFLLAIGLFTGYLYNKREDKTLTVLVDNKEDNKKINSTLKDSKVLSNQKIGNNNNLNKTSDRRSDPSKKTDNFYSKKDDSNQSGKKDQFNTLKKGQAEFQSLKKQFLVNKNQNNYSKEILIQENNEVVYYNKISVTGINNILAIYSIKRLTKDFKDEPVVLPIKVNYLPLTGDEPDKKEEKKEIQKWNIDLAYAPGNFQPNIQSNKASSYANSVQSNQAGRNVNSLSGNYFTPISKTAFQNASGAVDNDLSNSKPAFSYQVNFGAGYSLNSKFSINMGLQYLYQNSQITTSQYFTDNLTNSKTTYITDVVSTSNKTSQLETLDKVSINASSNRINSNSDIIVNNTYRYLSVPIMIRYKLVNKKIGISAGAGISADIFINNQIGNHKEGVSEQTFNSSNSIYKSLGYSGLLNLRMDYKLSKRYSFFLEPGFRTALSSFTKASSVNSYPISLNVGTGLRFQF